MNRHTLIPKETALAEPRFNVQTSPSANVVFSLSVPLLVTPFHISRDEEAGSGGAHEIIISVFWGEHYAYIASSLLG